MDGENAGNMPGNMLVICPVIWAALIDHCERKETCFSEFFLFMKSDAVNDGYRYRGGKLDKTWAMS